MRGVPRAFFEGLGSRSVIVGHCVGGGGACCRMEGREPGRESGYGGGGGRGGGDILPARAAPGGEAMEVRGEASYSGGIARRGGREGSR